MTFPNKFPKSCHKCNVRVEAYAGVCQKLNGVWVVEHVHCNHPVDTRQPIPQRSPKAEPKEDNLENHPAFRWMDQDLEESLF